MRKKTREMEIYINVLQKNLELIQGSKTYRLWQAYCRCRSFIMGLLRISAKKPLFNSSKKTFPGIKQVPHIQVKNAFSEVSIVIPAYNGSKTLPLLFKVIRTQQNITDYEIILIDSQSQDDTIKIAKSFNARIISINKDEFNHGLTRNLGAIRAKGKFVLFNTQDAIPMNNKTYANMLALLNHKPEIIGVSTRQVPYPNADLFARWEVLNHNTTLNLRDGNYISSLSRGINFYKLPFLSKRRMSLFDDVCSVVKKDKFLRIGGYHKLEFAEDVEFSIRALRKGYSIGVAGESGVIHSHTRSLSYFLYRYYTDNRVMNILFKQKSKIKFNSFKELLTNMLNTYIFINKVLSCIPKYTVVPNFEESLKLVIKNSNRSLRYSTNFINLTSELSNALNLEAPLHNKINKPNLILFEQFIAGYNNALNLIPFYQYNSGMIQEFIDKLFVNILGNNLALLIIKLNFFKQFNTKQPLDNLFLKNL